MLQEALAAHQRQPMPSALHAALLALLAMVRRAQGRLREVRRLSEQVLALTTSEGRTLPLAGAFLAYLLLGLTQCEQNDLHGAERTLRQCADLARQYQVTVYEILAQFYQGQVLCARGDLAGALDLVEQAEVVAGRYLSPHNLHELEGYRVILWLRQGDVGRAVAWAAQRGPDSARPRFTAYDYDRFALAQTRMAQGQWDAAHAAMANLLSDAEATGHGRYLIWALALQALILHAQGDAAGAIASLGRALTMPEPEGYVRVFLDEGALMAALLRDAFTRGVAPDYIAQLLAAFPRTEGRGLRTESAESIHSVLSPQSLALVETLSSREREVLRLLAEGKDNAAIARALVISISTVKSHVNHIFGKLGARNRLEATLRANELDLL